MTIRAYRDKTPVLGNDVYIDETALVIGDVVLGDDVSIWPMTVVRGDVNRIEIGRATNIQDSCVLHVTHGGEFSPEGFELNLGVEVTVGHGVVLHGCRIGDHCLIGIGAIVMDGAVIEDQVIVGAGGLVPPGKRLESGYLYVGSPVRPIRVLSDMEREFLLYSAKHYLLLKNDYLTAQSPHPYS
ncbi:MAG: gamma carbonic anhydrase family protein [Methylococcaceae bacterium]|nr:gamma carbonic anhydrase family protein [Methylococcaceae bacterium]